MQTYEVKISLDQGPSIIYDRNFKDRTSIREYIEHVGTYGVWHDDVLYYPAHRIVSIKVEPVE